MTMPYPRLSSRLLPQGLLLAGLILLAGCATDKEPYSVVLEEEEAPAVEQPAPAEPRVIAMEEETPAETVVFEPEHPQIYIVQKGDTLWDISARFLRDPWYWPEIWYKNPQIDNPHLIYPGDELAIVYINGQKRIMLNRRGPIGAAAGMKTVKLSPRIRAQSIDASIPAIPIEAIRQLLEKPLIIDEEQLAKAAYVLDSRDNHLANALDDTLYVRKLDYQNGNGRYQIFRPHKPLVDIETGEVLGYEALYVADGLLVRGGDPASVRVTASAREVLRDDRLLPIDNSVFESDFYPRPPKHKVKGRVISLLDGIARLGQYQTLVINLGKRDGLEVGNILGVNRVGRVVVDRYEDERNFKVKLPDERSGLIMIIRAYDKMSFALIMEANVPIKLNDLVVKP